MISLPKRKYYCLKKGWDLNICGVHLRFVKIRCNILLLL